MTMNTRRRFERDYPGLFDSEYKPQSPLEIGFMAIECTGFGLVNLVESMSVNVFNHLPPTKKIIHIGTPQRITIYSGDLREHLSSRSPFYRPEYIQQIEQMLTERNIKQTDFLKKRVVELGINSRNPGFTLSKQSLIKATHLICGQGFNDTYSMVFYRIEDRE